MFYYVLPGLGIYGGIKKAFHCADALNVGGYGCAVASPSGGRPDWFPSASSTLTRDDLAQRCLPSDTVLFSCPADLEFVESLPAARKIVDMQGANTPADVEMMGHDLEFISHGLHMTHVLLQQGRVAPHVPLGIPDAFRYDGEAKEPNTIAVMPRKGAGAIEAAEAVLKPGERLVSIDGASEAEVAERLQRADVFLAISPDEAFGLPPLEAMVAGCCVVGYSGIGGFEFMRHGETAWVVPNGRIDRLTEALRRVLDDPTLKDQLRRRGQEISTYYSMEREHEYLLRALGQLGAI